MDVSLSELKVPELKSRTRSVTKTGSGARVDQDKLHRAGALILEAIGENVFREGLRETPARFARMFQELCYGVGVDAASEITCTFKEGGEGLVVVRDISFNSLCEHHLVPFIGTAHIAYLPREGVVTGLSKLARVVELTARRPQVQERLTRQILVALQTLLGTDDVAVSIDATHYCVKSRGVMDSNSQTSTTALGLSCE